jgi:hypothetical protein
VEKLEKTPDTQILDYIRSCCQVITAKLWSFIAENSEFSAIPVESLGYADYPTARLFQLRFGFDVDRFVPAD